MGEAPSVPSNSAAPDALLRELDGPAFAEPWMAQPAPPVQQPWQSPAAQANKAPALEPIDLPPAIEQGVDMIYIDEDLVPRAVHDNNAMPGVSLEGFTIIVLPLTMAAVDMPTRMASGKFQGGITRPTPRGM